MTVEEKLSMDKRNLAGEEMGEKVRVVNLKDWLIVHYILA